MIVNAPVLVIILLRAIFTDLEALESLGYHARIHEVVFGFHRKLASRFAFAIYYLLDGSFNDVAAILDCRRDPAKLETRLHQMGR